MSKKIENSNPENNNTNYTSGYSYNQNINNQGSDKNNNNFQESINRSFDETKDNIKRSLDESKNQIPRYNTIVNSYQEQSLQIAKDISEDYLESQKSVINSLQSAWRPYFESYNGFVNNWSSPNTIVKSYARCVSNFADNAVSATRLSNNVIFSNLDSWKSVLQQARDNSRHLSNLNVNTAKTFEQNSREVADTAKDSSYSVSSSSNINTNTTSFDKDHINSKKI